MSLQSRISALITAVGADIKTLMDRTSALGAFMVGLSSSFSVDSTLRNLPFSRTSTHAFDPANWYSSGTNKHTPQKAGRWTYQYNIRFASTPNVKIWVWLYKNGTAIAVSGPWYAGSIANSGFGATFPSLSMNGTTDYAELKINADSGTWALSVDDQTNWFSGHFIGN